MTRTELARRVEQARAAVKQARDALSDIDLDAMEREQARELSGIFNALGTELRSLELLSDKLAK